MLTISLLCLFAFFAGLIDAAVGGGGLIQLPALFNLMPNMASTSLLGTNKLASACGTTFAARSFVGKVHIPWLLVLIIIMAIYTFIKKDFGTTREARPIGPRERILAIVIGGAIGFYDGLFGPGTGSFLIFLFIRVFGFDFILASACSKLVNIATNVAALAFFIPAGHVVYAVAAPMAVCNILGALTGTWIAVRRGAAFVRILFLVLLVLLIVKLSYDIFFK